MRSFAGGEVFRSGCCWIRGRGRIFYFSPGHETFPVYHQPEIRRILANGVRWAQRRWSSVDTVSSPNSPAGWFEPQRRQRAGSRAGPDAISHAFGQNCDSTALAATRSRPPADG